MSGTNGYAKDVAVRKIKRLPKNRNVSSSRVTYQCGYGDSFVTESLSEAWTHSSMHGPWPMKESGLLAPLHDSRRPLYNSGSTTLTASVDSPTIRKVF